MSRLWLGGKPGFSHVPRAAAKRCDHVRGSTRTSPSTSTTPGPSAETTIIITMLHTDKSEGESGQGEVYRAGERTSVALSVPPRNLFPSWALDLGFVFRSIFSPLLLCCARRTSLRWDQLRSGQEPSHGSKPWCPILSINRVLRHRSGPTHTMRLTYDNSFSMSQSPRWAQQESKGAKELGREQCPCPKRRRQLGQRGN